MKKLLIAKYGSSCLVDEQGIDQKRIDAYAKRLASLADYDLVVVSSGAVAIGRRLWKEAGLTDTDVSNQVLAAMGSAGIAEAWRQAFARNKRLTGQILVTHHEIDDKLEGANLRRALLANAQSKVVSIVNQNDALSDVELEKLSYGGDNDGLAAHIASLLAADQLLILTGVDGFLNHGKVQSVVNAGEVEDLHEYLFEGSEDGTGSMQSKLEAAARAARAGVTTHIANAASNYADALDNITGTRVVQ